MARHQFAIPPNISLALASALWAVATVISKQLLTSVPPITLLVLQLAPSVVVLWLLVVASGRKYLAWRDLFPVALIGVLNPGLSYTLSMLGLSQTTASVATLLWAAEPALIVALAWCVLREVITTRLVAFTVTAACGVVLVSGLLSRDNLTAGSGLGATFVLGGVLCCALYTVLSRKIALSIDPLLTVTIQQTVGLLWAAAIWPLELHGNAADAVLALPARELVGGMITGLMYYALAFWLYLSGLRLVPASTAGIFINLTPVFGVAAAYVFLGERLSQTQWLGAAIILASVCALLLSGKSEVNTPAPSSTP